MFKVIYLKNGVERVHYGFSKSINEFIWGMYDDEKQEDIEWFLKLCPTLKVFIKCLKRLDKVGRE